MKNKASSPPVPESRKIKPVSIKFWWNLVDASFHNDVARLTPGIGYQISPIWRTAFLLGYTYTKNTVGGDFNSSNIIFRFRVYHTLGKKDQLLNPVC